MTRFRSGQTPWNKGLTKDTDQRVQQIATSLIGRKYPDRSGSAHHNWKNGATSAAMKIRKSTEYSAWRAAVFERDDYTCQRCGERGRHLEANHIKAFAEHPDLRLEVTNGETLCKPCHRQTPKPKITRRWTPEDRRRQSEAQKRRWAEGRGPVIRRTPEWTAKLAATARGRVPWNKGLTKDGHPSVAAMAAKARVRMAGKKGPGNPVWKRWHPDHASVTERQDPA